MIYKDLSDVTLEDSVVPLTKFLILTFIFKLIKMVSLLLNKKPTFAKKGKNLNELKQELEIDVHKVDVAIAKADALVTRHIQGC